MDNAGVAFDFYVFKFPLSRNDDNLETMVI